MIVQGILTLLFLALGIVFALGKGAFLVAGDNTMSKEEKAGFDEKKLLKNMSILFFCCTACMAVGFVGALLDRIWLLDLGYGLLVLFAVYFAIRINQVSKK
jgi:nitrate reductase NapE component